MIDIQWYCEQPRPLVAAFHFTPDLALKVLMGEETLPWGLQVSGEWNSETRTLHDAWIPRGISPAFRLGDVIFQDAHGHILGMESYLFFARYKHIEKSEDF